MRRTIPVRVPTRPTSGPSQNGQSKGTLEAQPKAWTTRALVSAGRHASPDVARILNGATNFLETGRMLQQARIHTPAPLRSRFAVFDVAIERAQSAANPVYLEFGVWKGESIAYWAAGLRNPGAIFVGFDSFEGLPETWTAGAQRGAFSTTGLEPVITDRRVSFVKGWFRDTIAPYVVPAHDLLIVNIDCDLYASARVVLNTIGRRLEVGDLLYLDEFHDRLHEGRAFHEFREESGYHFECVARSAGATHMLFVRTR